MGDDPSATFFIVGYVAPVDAPPCFVAPVFWNISVNATLPLEPLLRMKAFDESLPVYIQRPTSCGEFIFSFDRYDIEARPNFLGRPPQRGCESFLDISGNYFFDRRIDALYWSIAGSPIERHFINDEHYVAIKKLLVESHWAKEGDPFVFAFRNANGTVVCGDRDTVRRHLKDIADSMRQHPGIFLDIAAFLDDQAMKKQANELLEDEMSKYSINVRRDTLKWSRL